MRLVASLGHYLATTGDDTVYLHQYAPSVVEVALGDGEIVLTVDTDYPWSGTVTVTVDRAPDATWELSLRVPDWCPNARAAVAGEVRTTPDQQGYLTSRRHWHPGDTLTLELDMPARFTYPDPHIDAVRGRVAVERGPLVYCFEQADQPDKVEVDQLGLAPGASLTTHHHHDDSRGVGRTVTAIPYFQCDNRDGRAMRVWLTRVDGVSR